MKFIGKPGIEKKTRYKVGEELRESHATNVVLEHLGLAERVSDTTKEDTPRRRGRPPKQQEYQTRDLQASGHAVGAMTTDNIPDVTDEK